MGITKVWNFLEKYENIGGNKQAAWFISSVPLHSLSETLNNFISLAQTSRLCLSSVHTDFIETSYVVHLQHSRQYQTKAITANIK